MVLGDEIDLGEHEEDRTIEIADETKEELVFTGPGAVGALTCGCSSFWIRCCFELDAARSVHQHEDEVAGFESFVDLLQHSAIEMRAGLVNAGSVDKDDLRRRMDALARRNLDHSNDAVAGGLRLGGDDGHLFAGKGVEQRAFADVGPAENGDKSGFQGVFKLPTPIIANLRLARWPDLHMRDPALLSANQLMGDAVISHELNSHSSLRL